MIHYQTDILKAVAEINRTWEEPQCYLVALLLASQFGGQIYYDHNHCITLIGECFYDKTGIFLGSDLVRSNYIPLEEYGIDIKKTLMDALIQKHLKIDMI